MTKTEILKILETKLSPKRLQHTLNVAEQAVLLGQHYGLDLQKCETAALLHDIAKEDSERELLQNIDNSVILFCDIFKQSKKIWHAFAGAGYIEKHGITQDKDIINAVRYHTTGRENMSDLEKVIFLSDFTSQERSFEGVDQLRERVFVSLEQAMFYALNSALSFLLQKNEAIYPQTVLAYNYYRLRLRLH